MKARKKMIYYGHVLKADGDNLDKVTVVDRGVDRNLIWGYKIFWGRYKT